MIQILHKRSIILVLSFLSITILNCKEPNEYQQKVTEELAKEARNDSLIFDYTFGMSKEDFFTYSWEINKQGLVVNGSGAEIVQDVDWLKSPARRSFYPKFEKDKIIQFPMEYSYNGWAPWNDHLVSDSLEVDILENLSIEYNADFYTMMDQDSTVIYYHIDGNREIRVFIVDKTKVRVLFSDLTKVNL